MAFLVAWELQNHVGNTLYKTNNYQNKNGAISHNGMNKILASKIRS